MGIYNKLQLKDGDSLAKKIAHLMCYLNNSKTNYECAELSRMIYNSPHLYSSCDVIAKHNDHIIIFCYEHNLSRSRKESIKLLTYAGKAFEKLDMDIRITKFLINHYGDLERIVK